MKNLKKTLAVVLAFAMILGMGAISTFAYTDVAEGTVVSEAVSILSNLDILTGFEDGTFRPAETVTRAQMAAIICRVLGYEDQAQSSMGSTVFNDVAADHWASGYINVAQAQQIINGYGDGNYGPEDKVTYEQAVKMIVSALGYDLAAQSKGGYPTGYLAIASTKGITKNANGRVGDAAARSAIAVLVYNSLEVELMDQTSWSTGAAGDEYGMTGETILSRYLGVKKYEGVVTTTPLTELAGTTAFDPEEEAKVGFTGLKGWGFDGKNYVLGALAAGEVPAAVNASLIEDADKFLGKKVVAYIGTEADPETAEKMIYAIAEKQGANESFKLNANQLVSDTEDGKLVYKKPGSNKKYDVKIALAETYVNYANVSDPADSDAVIDLFVNDDDVFTGGTLELIDSDTTQAGYETLIAVAYNSEAVVEEVEVDAEDVFFTLYTGELDDVDMESETESVVVYKDGEVVEASAIAAGDTVSTVEIGEVARALYVSSKNVTGSVDGWTDEKVTIAGEEYAPSAIAAEDGLTLVSLQNMEGIFYLNVDGQIAYADGSVAKGAYGFILNTGKDSGMGSKYYATVIGADGEVKTYNYAKNVEIGTTSYTAQGASAAIATLMNATADVYDSTGEDEDKTKALATYTADEAYAHVDTAASLLFEIKVKNNEIKALKAVGTSTPEDEDDKSKYNADTQSLGAKTFDETSVMFALAGAWNADAKIEEEDIKVGKVIEMLADEEEYYVALASIENGIYKAAIGYNLVTSVAVDSEVIVVTGKKTISYNDDTAVVITGLQAGKEVEVKLYNEDNTSVVTTASTLAIGDIILTSTVNAEGVADDLKVILDKSEGDLDETDYSAKKTYLGYQDAVDSDANFIWFDDAMTGITEAGANGEGEGDNFMVMQKSANCVLVDYTEDADEPEIGKKSLSKSIIGNTSKYRSDVFVRVVDEQVIDVIVYRTPITE